MKTNRVQHEPLDRSTQSSNADPGSTVNKMERSLPPIPKLRLQTTSLSSLQPNSSSPNQSASNLSLRESSKRTESPCSFSAPLSARSATTPRGIPIRSCLSLAGTAPASPAASRRNHAPSEPLARARRFTAQGKREVSLSQDNICRRTNSHPQQEKSPGINPISQAQTSQSPDYSILSPTLHKYQQEHPTPSTPRFQLTAPHLKLTPEGHVSPQSLVRILGGPVNLSCDPATFREQIQQLKKIKEELEHAAKEEKEPSESDPTETVSQLT